MRVALAVTLSLTLMTYALSAKAAQVHVSNPDELRAAIAAAKAGDEITLAPGIYALSGSKIACSADGTPSAPIVVRSSTPLAAKLELSTVEGFFVTGAHWHFEGLDVQGTCPVDDDCEHAFHVAGASGFVLRSSRIVDFNAQLKVNATAQGAAIPHGGLVEGCEIYDTRARHTNNPVTKLNIDSGDGWVVRANYIHDFHKTSNSPSYGAFMKSGGKNGLFERNLVLCSRDVTTKAAVTIGLSFGGGLTGPRYCAPAFDAETPCAVEHEDGVMRNNVIANCSDVGIYVAKGKGTSLLHNTLIATSGVDFRFDTTTGEARGNVVGGAMRNRDGATHVASDNLTGVERALFEAMYVAPLLGDLRRKGDLSALLGKVAASPSVPDDYCARARTGNWDLGALQHSLGDCATVPPPLGASGDGSGDDAGAPSEGDDDWVAWDGGDASAPSGSAADDEGASGQEPAHADGGCGCRTTRSNAPGSVPLGLALATLAALRRRR